MITVKMTKTEYEAYLLYLRSIELMQMDRNSEHEKSSLEEYLSNPENRKEIEAGLDDIKAGRITYVEPEDIWANIK
jgi:PHD/YefM family antitoxin component YafN of YafNO toxin-antitoxin module